MLALLKESKLLINIALPLTISGFLEASIGFSSTAFLAHLGQRELAAGALASWLFITMMVIMWGILSSISTLVAQYHGANDQAAIVRVMRDSFILAALLAAPALLLLWQGAPLLLLIGENKATIELTRAYLHSLMWSVLPDFVMMILLQLVIGLGRTRINLFFTLLWVPLNIAFNYLLMFGKCGLPALGIVGIGLGTSAAFWVTTSLLCMYLFTHKTYRVYFQFQQMQQLSSQLGELLRIGLPMGFMYCLEIAFFMALTLLMGKLSYQALAANQITLQYLWQVSVVTGCLSQAITVRVGHTIGAKNKATCWQVVNAGAIIGTLFMLLVAGVYWWLPEYIIKIDLNPHVLANQPIMHLAKEFLALCAVFQILETLRFAAFGALRSLKDTKFALFASLFMFWIVALSSGYCLAFHNGWGGQGLWVGLLLGVTCGALLLWLRLIYKLKHWQVVM